MLDKTVCDIIDAVKTSVCISGPIPLPTKTERFKGGNSKTVIHKRMLELEDVTEVPEILMNMQIPIGVHVEMK